MRRLFTAFFVFSIVIGSFGLAAAQTVPVPQKGTPAPVVVGLDVSKEAYVIEHYSTKVVFDAAGKGQRETTATIKMLADAGVKTFAVLNFAYTSANESVELPYVRVRKADGTVVNTPDYNVQDMPADVTRTAPMYSDIHEKHVAVKGLGVGDVLEYSVRYSVTKPQIPGQFWYEHTFFQQEIVKDERLEIHVPSGKNVMVVNRGYKPEISEEGAEKVYRWKSSNLARKEGGEADEEQEDKKPSVQVTTFAKWEEIGNWYGELQREQVTLTPAIEAKAAELTKGLKSDEEKIKAIYNFVSLRIHYISLSFGIGRFQPHAAEDTLGNEYGDCKDKHTLLASLLKAAGYDAWPVLINASRKIDEDVPSIGQFNHVITAVPRGENIVWLDTTAEVAPFGLILPNLRNRKALVIPTGKAPYLVTTPQNPPFPQTQLFVAEGKLSSDGTLTAHIEQDIAGDTEVLLRTVYRQVPQAQWKDLAQRISYGAGFAGDVSDVKVSAPDDLSRKLHISYEYTRKKYSDWENGRILPPLPPVGIEYQDPDKKKPKGPVFLGMPGELVYRSRVQLPEGCSLKLPKNLDLVESYAEYHTTNTVANGLYLVEHRFVVKKSEIPVSEWENYKKFQKAVSDDKLTFVPMDGANLVAKMENSDDPAALFRMAFAASERRDYAGSQKLYERVIEKDPKYEGAHYNLALLLVRQNKLADALVELRKEEELSTKDWQAYHLAATLLKQLHREDDAVAEYQKLLKVDPRNLQAAQRLCAMLLEQHKYSQATEIVETSGKNLPEIYSLQLMLGTALLKNGQTQSGAAYVRKAIQSTNGSKDSGVLNDAAYALAESKVELELAKTWAEKAVMMVEADSAKQASEDDFGMANELAAAWDTLGWTYHQRGEYGQAEPYLRASWMLSQRVTGGFHLAQNYERLGKIAAAKQTYLYAMNTEQYSFSSPEESTAYRTEVDRCRARYEKLTGHAALSGIKRLPNGEWSLTPREELQRMRTVKLANTTGATGKAEFSIVFAPGKIEAVRCLGGEDEVRGIAAKIETAKLVAEFPPHSNAKIVRRAVAKCSRTGCELELKPPSEYALARSMVE